MSYRLGWGLQVSPDPLRLPRKPPRLVVVITFRSRSIRSSLSLHPLPRSLLFSSFPFPQQTTGSSSFTASASPAASSTITTLRPLLMIFHFHFPFPSACRSPPGAMTGRCPLSAVRCPRCATLDVLPSLEAHLSRVLGLDAATPLWRLGFSFRMSKNIRSIFGS